MGGRLEHEIRLLPQVLACSFSKDGYVVVLIDVSADPSSIRPAVERILHNAGSDAAIRLIGPPEAVEAASTRVASPLIATATVATVAAIGVGALVGGLATAADRPAKPVTVERSAGSAAVAPTDSIDLLRGIQVSAFAPVAPIALPAETPDHHPRVLPASHGAAAEAVSLTKALPPLQGVGTQQQTVEPSSPRHGAWHVHGTHRKGKGPPPWSHSERFSGNREKGRGRG